MVYCGQPSRGCQMCRTRRIKCDETKPTCNRCAKSRRQCPGYKDDFDLVFRNETQATERRAQKVNRKALAHKATTKRDSMSCSSVSPISPTSSTASSMIAPPAFSIQDRAACHFIANFILLPRDGRIVGHLDFVLPLLKQEGPDSHIQHAFNACSMAFLNNRKSVGFQLWEKAMNEYLLALSRTNAALRDKETQLADSTLATVLLLGMFESISAKQLDASNWGSHIKGAVQLVKARGKKQVRTRTGLQLFITVRSLMAIYCLTTAKSPAMGAEWWVEDVGMARADMGIRGLMIRTGEIRAQMTQIMNRAVKTPQTVELMIEIIRKAQAMDRDVAAWQQGLPEEYRHTTIAWQDDDVVTDGDYGRLEVFPGRVDVYEDIWIASFNNSARSVRLILHAIIVRCAAWVCAPMDYRITPEYVTATSVCRDSITDIIASVPYFLGWHLKRKGLAGDDDEPIKTSNFGTFACGEEDGIKGLAGYLVTWPLTVVISQDYVTDAQRSWVLGRLQTIGGDLGVKYALAVSQLQMRAPSMMIRRDGLMPPPPPPSPPLPQQQQQQQQQQQHTTTVTDADIADTPQVQIPPRRDSTQQLKVEYDDDGLNGHIDAYQFKQEWIRT